MKLPPDIKTCLVVSYGPVPTPQYQTVEGGGMRAWGLAEGLRRNGIRTTVAVNNSFPQELKEHEGIKLTNWGQDNYFVDLMNTYDAVIVSYCMGGDSVFIAENVSDNVQLILDAYVPIYIEVSARESKDIDTEFRNYLDDIKRFNRVLRRGDYFLCAHDAQKVFYTGVLASLGIINPRSYRNDRIIVAPFGIHDVPAKADTNPYLELGIKASDFVVMWFGGLYPWFRVEEMLEAILSLSKHDDFKFVIVGGKNPFNPNPDFSKQYDKALDFATEHDLLNKTLFFVDWVDFSKRINWFKHASIVVSLNQPGEENRFSWRTRVMDFVWGELAILTNGGDPLSEDLLRGNAALRLSTLSAAEIEKVLYHAYEDPRVIKAVQKKIIELKPRYYWQHVTEPITAVIAAGETPYSEEMHHKKELHISSIENDKNTLDTPRGRLHKIKRVARLPLRAVSYAKRKGLRRSVSLALNIAKTQAASRLQRSGRRYVFIGHPMDNTGAPVVLMQIIHEYAARYGAKNVHLVVPYIAPNHLRTLREMGIKVDKAALGLGRRLIKLQLNLRSDDFVLLNTMAVYDNYRDYVLNALRDGEIKHAYWFIHEDKAQIPIINNGFMQKSTISRIRKLANAGELTIVTPSRQTKEEYVELLGTKHVQTVPLLVDVPEKYQKPRSVNDYRTIRFFISGAAGDGRKGQLIAIAALGEFMATYYSKNPKAYRDFKLCLLSVSEDYISQQITWIGTSLLGKRIEIHPPVPRTEALKLASECNVVICCSLNETFGLYVAEGMHMGHVVLRNNAAGMVEQLSEGKNGYFIDHTDVKQFARVIEKVLNKNTTSDKKLQQMGATSQKMISKFGDNDYLQKIESLTPPQENE